MSALDRLLMRRMLHSAALCHGVLWVLAVAVEGAGRLRSLLEGGSPWAWLLWPGGLVAPAALALAPALTLWRMKLRGEDLALGSLGVSPLRPGAIAAGVGALWGAALVVIGAGPAGPPPAHTGGQSWAFPEGLLAAGQVSADGHELLDVVWLPLDADLPAATIAASRAVFTQGAWSLEGLRSLPSGAGAAHPLPLDASPRLLAPPTSLWHLPTAWRWARRGWELPPELRAAGVELTSPLWLGLAGLGGAAAGGLGGAGWLAGLGALGAGVGVTVGLLGLVKGEGGALAAALAALLMVGLLWRRRAHQPWR